MLTRSTLSGTLFCIALFAVGCGSPSSSTDKASAEPPSPATEPAKAQTTAPAPAENAPVETPVSAPETVAAAAQDTTDQVGAKNDASFSLLPDLVIIDGGKGQLGRAVQVLEKYELMDKVPVVGLAKQNEEIFLPNKSAPLILPRHSQGLYLIQRIGDEAHRYGITAHRKSGRRSVWHRNWIQFLGLGRCGEKRS